MSVAELSTVISPEPADRLWSLHEYHKLIELGWFDRQRLELIGGRIVQMSPQKEAHATGILLVERLLRRVFDNGYTIRIQMPLAAGGASEPEPDVAVVRGDPRDFADHPADPLLVVEVSDSTLAFDRNVKSSLYASAGWAECWILNLSERCLEVFRNPVADMTRPFRHRYSLVTTFQEGQTVTPLAAPQAQFAVSDMLPLSNSSL